MTTTRNEAMYPSPPSTNHEIASTPKTSFRTQNAFIPVNRAMDGRTQDKSAATYDSHETDASHGLELASDLESDSDSLEDLEETPCPVRTRVLPARRTRVARKPYTDFYEACDVEAESESESAASPTIPASQNGRKAHSKRMQRNANNGNDNDSEDTDNGGGAHEVDLADDGSEDEYDPIKLRCERKKREEMEGIRRMR